MRTQAQANAPEQGPHRATGDVWAIVLVGTRHPARRVASTCVPTASGDVVPAPEGHTCAQNGVIGRNAWSNEANDLEVQASASLTSLLSLAVATMWGFAR